MAAKKKKTTRSRSSLGRGMTDRKAPAKKARLKPSRDHLTRLREICLSLPEAHEVSAWGEPTFRVKNTIFAMHASAGNHHGAGRPAVCILSGRIDQDPVLRARPGRYFKPQHV